MKQKILYSIAILAFVTQSALMSGQGIYDALRFSQNFYEGTARSVALGNAMTSIGGDLGAITINPAASGVYRYSEVAITPALYNSVDKTNYLNNDTKTLKTNFNIPNIGIVGVFDTGRRSGVKSVNISATYSGVNNFNERTSASGRQANSSWLASVAANTNGIEGDKLTLGEGNNWDKPYYGEASWSSVLAWNTFLIDTLPGTTNQYIAATENLYGDIIEVGGPLEQKFYRDISGSNSEVTLNISMNISEKLFLGLNFGTQSLYYNQKETFTERAVNPDDFQTGFDYFKHTYSQITSGVGFNAKFGFIYNPIKGLRIGGSISTPTWLLLNDRWEEIIETRNDLLDTGYAQEYSPIGEYSYKVNTPFRVNAGASYVFGKYGFLSVDYEYADYSTIKMMDRNGDASNFEFENDDIKSYFKQTHNFRVGGEIKVIPAIAIRAGYNYYASAEKEYDATKHLGSLGIGYRTKGSFFVDLAYQQQLNSTHEEYTLYGDYLGIEAPTMKNSYYKWKLLLTLGFRF